MTSNPATTFVNLSFAFLTGIFFTGISIVLWTFVMAHIARPTMQITAFNVVPKVLRVGDTFTYTGTYIKEQDCPGQWTIRAVNYNTGTIYQIGSGRLGTHPPGEYKASWKMQIQVYLPPGPYDFMEIIDGQCDGGISFVARSPRDRVIIQGDGTED